MCIRDRYQRRVHGKYILENKFENIDRFTEKKIKSTSNYYLKEIEKYFSEKKLKCNASIMLFYYLINIQKIKSNIEKKINKTGVNEIILKFLSKIKDIYQEHDFPNLSSFFICMFLRFSIEKLISVKTIEELKTNVQSNGILKNNPLSATLRLYMLKLLRGTKTSFEEMKKTMKKHMCLKALEINSFPRAIPTDDVSYNCLLYTSPSPRDLSTSRMPSSA
eukprot:TRINITY_DN23318_c0_g1_i2.p1 TRINITY_DN23318_c0_g1~~TRINITY_DN23318_c0_g1_i2.p1  ORF type:complete len:220 (+),score=62.39 TRINITY_DN23318_c0_g1_i2:166-825(+)